MLLNDCFFLIDVLNSNSTILLSFFSNLPSYITTLIAIAAFVWALKKYGLEREKETKLTIEITSTNYIFEGINYTYLDILLHNEGQVKVDAKKRFENGKAIDYVYQDCLEKLIYSVELQVKKVKNYPVASDWFNNDHYEKIKNLEQINLLVDFEDPDDSKDLSFYIEPKESYHLGCWMQLEVGLYEAKVNFVGPNEHNDYWVRKKPFQVL